MPVQEAGGTSSIYLSPLNALRVAKGFATALVLLPFLMRAVAVGRGAWFGYGMIAGLLGVAAAAAVERLAFTGLFNFATEYRVLGPFASEHIGGGHIGAYLAMALPFVMTPLMRPRFGGALLALAAALAGGYALVVTSSRTGYAVGAVGMAVVALLWPLASLRRRWLALVLPVPLLLGLAGVVVAAAVNAQFMESRFRTVVPDLDLRMGNWQTGLAARDPGWGAVLFGMGIGTYPRLAAAREAGRAVPSNFVLRDENGKKYLSVLVRSRDYLGQKVKIPAEGDLHLTLAVRPQGGPTTVVAILCAKWLLYSQDCVSAPLSAPSLSPSEWSDATADFKAPALAELRRVTPVPRPIDLSFDFPRGQWTDFTAASLRDADGNELLANGAFADGTARWLFTDDDDTAWRIMNLFLLLFFEGGAIGVAAFLLLVGFAGINAFGAILRGERFGVPIVASLLAFLAAGTMDGLAEAPRLDAVFFLVALAGLVIRHPPAAGATSFARSRSGDDV
jgi:O-antigen ligase